MNRINLYILKEITPSVLAGVIILTLVVITQQLIKISDYIIAGGVPALEIGKLILYSLPAFFEISIPVSLILGITIAFSRLAIDSEIIALRASGIRIQQLLLPVAILSAAGFLTVSYLTIYGSSVGYHNLYTTIRKISFYGSREIIKEGVFTKLTDSTLIYVDHLSPDGAKMKGILVSEKKNFDEPVIITADRGEMVSPKMGEEGGLVLTNGIMDQKIKGENTHRVVTFERLKYIIGDPAGRGPARSKKPKEISVPDILRIIREGGIPRNRMIDLMFSLHRRLALPFACIIFAFFAVPMGVVQRSRGKSSSFFITGIVVFVYYLFLGIGKSMKGLSPVLSLGTLWLPNILFGFITIYTFRKVERDPGFTARLTSILRRKG